MDMKRILQAMDGVSTKPVEGANDMKKFLQVITEGANPHKVSLPVQMAMQHYQSQEVKTPSKPVPGRTSTLQKYFHEAEQEVIAEQAAEKEYKQQILRQYASTIAERVMMKESKQDSVEVSAKRAAIKDLVDKDIYSNHKDDEFKNVDDKHHKKTKYLSEKSKTEKQARFMAAAAHDPQFAARTGIKQSVAKEFNKADTGTKKLSNAMKHKPKKKVQETEIPDHSMGFTGGVGPGVMPNEGADSEMDRVRRYRMMRRISKKTGIGLSDLELATDAELHKLYAEHGLQEAAKTLKNSNPCWKGYHPVGTKKKGGRTVPNCVPKE